MDASRVTGSGRMGRSQARARLAVALPVAFLVLCGPGFANFVTTPWSAVAQSAAASRSRVAREASAKGTQAVDDADMIKQLRAWKAAGGGKKGFGDDAAPPEPPKKTAKSYSSRDFAAAPAEESFNAPPTSNTRSSSATTQEAIGELARLGQQEAQPDQLSPQQLIMVFLTFWAGWRQRNGIPTDIDLNPKQKQTVVLLIQMTLARIGSSAEFWPFVCSELGQSREPAMKDLLAGLTGRPQ
mmetsp:Transcript_21882/g.75250  ORF Transcript_21882/g.75250 Transcript_21882/m.75250 type:complete len:241 (+) Transcript_21882:76-798(+)